MAHALAQAPSGSGPSWPKGGLAKGVWTSRRLRRGEVGLAEQPATPKGQADRGKAGDEVTARPSLAEALADSVANQRVRPGVISPSTPTGALYGPKPVAS
jgi:hypothetical protein